MAEAFTRWTRSEEQGLCPNVKNPTFNVGMVFCAIKNSELAIGIKNFSTYQCRVFNFYTMSLPSPGSLLKMYAATADKVRYMIVRIGIPITELNGSIVKLK